MHKRQIIHVHKTNEIYYAFYYINLAHFRFLFFDVGRKIMPIVIQDKDESMLLLV